ncbi:MAG: acyl-CoA carboxylase subunit beta [Firmicutes bacterium]|nr:acyl-CoA carboxylase subunit beta [Bacillota bacterium]
MTVEQTKTANVSEEKSDTDNLAQGTGKLDELVLKKTQALRPGTERALEAQLAKGKMTARERVNYLLDEDSFQELGLLVRHRAFGSGLEENRPYTDGVICGVGTIDGRKVCLYSQDFTVFGGSLGAAHAEKINQVQDLALQLGVPVIGISDGGGARIQEGVAALNGFGEIFRRNSRSSGVIPQISVIMGPSAGGAVYSPALTDFIFMVQGTSHMFITGPDVVKTVTGEDVSSEQLGGATTHATRSGVAAFVAGDEKSCLDKVKELLGYLPSNNLLDPPELLTGDDPGRLIEELDSIIPEKPNQPYDVKKIITLVADEGEFMEYLPHFAMNIACGFARLGGKVVGIVANQPQMLAGVLDIDASEKAARFIRTCDAFNIPLVTLVDVPGFMPGTDQEYGGIIRKGAKLLYAYCESSVPRIQVILRKAYGGAYIVMDSKSIGADISFAWPSAELAVMGPEAAVEIVHKRELAQSDNPQVRKAELVKGYTERFSNPYQAAEFGFVDEVIDPKETRKVLIRSINILETKRDELPKRKHGNIPL